ncbi:MULTISPECIES: hypothetical protein [Stenotrophomonas]|jgi:hypothetical protein|uniref:hypothetical protein n=1 Tax=Stenotrophomonas TaxID=40323 RepID=UPI000B06EA17|nr:MULTISPECIES: hypothetical protein [Stenotrophomonas]MBH1692914.1 hypothetical protein [Stenotrophomonas maltophilia]MBH1816988.1 hypothetical protein [Stenotrophomonas maltophilia]MBN5158345.1 hypothetical protein [Stenotrophomonas maltophilia]MCU1031225.1 hypothetical protein [Stenotrophomonas maltophilia]MDG2510583.1 hypothetical protein [Stenotrophomonas maltophilia]
MNNEVIELDMNEVEQVSGGNPLVVAGTVGAVLAFAYQVGKDMAARDALQCPAR